MLSDSDSSDGGISIGELEKRRQYDAAARRDRAARGDSSDSDDSLCLSLVEKQRRERYDVEAAAARDRRRADRRSMDDGASLRSPPLRSPTTSSRGDRSATSPDLPGAKARRLNESACAERVPPPMPSSESDGDEEDELRPGTADTAPVPSSAVRASAAGAGAAAARHLQAAESAAADMGIAKRLARVGVTAGPETMGLLRVTDMKRVASAPSLARVAAAPLRRAASWPSLGESEPARGYSLGDGWVGGGGTPDEVSQPSSYVREIRNVAFAVSSTHAPSDLCRADLLSPKATEVRVGVEPALGSLFAACNIRQDDVDVEAVRAKLRHDEEVNQRRNEGHAAAVARRAASLQNLKKGVKKR